MATKPSTNSITPEEYLAGEQLSEVRHEYHAGQVYAMVGASRNHNLISGNLYSTLLSALAGSDCTPYIADLKVRLTDTTGSHFFYPDVLVSCDDEDADPYYTDNPVLIVEVLSNSTERYDRAEKFHHYRHIPSLQEYLLIAQDLQRVELYRRRTGWDLELFGEGEVVELESVSAEVAVEVLYRQVQFADGTATT